MKKIGLYLVVLMMFLSGCAVMNTSMMETAETVEPGHPKFGVEYGYGLDLTSTILITSIPSDSTNFNATGLLSLPVYGMKAGIGLTDKIDINGKVWISLGGVGTKVYLKYRFPYDSEKASLAIMPGLTFVTTESDEEEGENTLEIAEINSYGFEAPFLATYRVGKALAVTGMARYSADFISIVEDDIDEAFMLNRFGVVGGLSLELGPLYFRPEVGVEMAAQKYGSFGVAPIFAIGAGFDF
ncbi:MAG: hypothetical protein DRH89_06215 [Candidatus Cloacimonadota bacterium]|nr:MAG: hypothetical protein DRH89_06215 [Candidatus Cloacimonadota bacterium]HHE40306.1 hypothetical protein [Candidatus Cloacimonadota bacterium]